MKLRQGKTIGFTELIKYFLLKWRTIFIFMLSFSILAGGVGFIKTYLDNQGVKNQTESKDYSQYEEALTEKEIQEVKDTVDDYLSYEKIYLDYKDYMSNSIKMQLDANSVPTKKIVYQVNDNNECSNIVDVYVETLLNSDICKTIVQDLGLNIDESYVKELINITSSNINSLEEYTGQNYNILESDISNGKSALFTIEIISNSQNDCEKIGDIIEGEITKVSLELQKQFGNFGIKKVNETLYEETNRALLLEQQTMANEMYSTSNLMRNLEATLTEQQKLYFEVLLDDDIEKVVTESNDNNLEKSSSKDDVSYQYINIKYILLGAVGGLIICCFYILCKLFFNDRLISNYYILEDLQAPLLGVVRGDKKKCTLGKKIDCFIENFFLDEKTPTDDKLKMMCANIKLISQKNNIKKIFITSSIDLRENNDIIVKLSKQLEEYGISFVIGKSILHCEESLKKCIDMDAIIFIETRNKSSLKEISNEIDCCKKYELDNLGFIIVE